MRETLTSIYATAQDRDITFLAAGFAYYAFVSLIPLVILAIVAGSIVGGEDLAERLVTSAGDLMPAAGDELLTDVLTTESGRAEATVVALAVAAWGAIKVFRGLSTAFDTVYASAADDSIVEQVVDGLIAVLAVAAALALMIALGVAIGFVRIPFAGLLSWAVLLVGLFFAFLPIYYRLPPVPVTVREALPGAALAAVGWVVLQVGFQIYAANAGQYEAYGAVGAVLVLVTWLYFAGILITLGAVVNVVLSDRAINATA
ncbi:YihY/virulence factor BrkB family protein [Saliphagus infecundisoli]|uniref:YihY/virulence factor BrkB family protein n=1 Tax=Saliphagus infecundisoli TaxID=1849069 RepID=A0ABD5QF25_9EURY|nr:YihY/virulence factor BrkB family protein [Saliphagus infecundisoli]